MVAFMTKLFGALLTLAMVGSYGMAPAFANHHAGAHAAPAAKVCAKCHKTLDQQNNCACKKDAKAAPKHDDHHGDAKHDDHHGDAKHDDHHGDAKHDDHHGDAKHDDNGSHH